MPGWLTKATNVLRWTTPAPPAPPPAFEISCPCGEVMRGFRRQSFQRVICKTCGDPFFILPGNAYPVPAAPPEKKKVKPPHSRPDKLASAVSSVVVEEDTDLAVETPTAEQEVANRPSRKARQAAKPRPPRNALAIEQIERAPRRIITPLRVAGVLTLVLAVATGYQFVRNRQIARAERAYREQFELGREALAAGEFATAAGHLREAQQALEVLGRNDSAARQTRQMQREATAISRLMSVPLLTVLLEGEQAAQQQQLAAWQDQFQRRFGGTWLVLQTALSKTGEGQDGSRFELASPLSLGETLVRMKFDGALPDEIAQAADWPEIIIAAQVSACTLDEHPQRAWVFTLNGPSAFLWTDYKSLASIGFGPDELHTEAQLEELLDLQGRAMGVVE